MSVELPQLEAAFRPSDVRMFARSHLPFIGTFRRAEIEIAAAVMVSAMAHHGDAWAPVTARQMSDWMEVERDRTEGRWRQLFSNPFARPNFIAIIEDGWAVDASTEEAGTRLAFTQEAIDQMLAKGWCAQ